MILALFAAVAFAAAFVQGAIGIGFALIVAPVIGIFRPELLPVTLLILMLPLNAQIAGRERAAIDRRGAVWITLGRFAGTFLGMGLLATLSAHQLGVAAGWFTVIAAAMALLAPPFQPGRASSLAAGVVTGITETSTGIAGPPIALLYQHASGAVLRATVAICFLVGEAISVVMLALAGQIHRDQFLTAVALIPPVWLGVTLSGRVHALLPPARLRVAVLIFALISGAFLILR